MDKKRKYLELLFRKQLLEETLKQNEESLNQSGMMLLMQSLDKNIKLKGEFRLILLKTWIKEVEDEINELQYDFDTYLLGEVEKQYRDKIQEIIKFYNENKGSEEVNA